jgi:lysophospholipase L1-like esterase/predicted ester cyclase
VTLPHGGAQTFVIAPSAGYRVSDVLVDGASVGPVTTYTFSAVTANHAIGATFAVDTRTIAASAGPNGDISPSGAVAVPYGGSQTFAITPAAGHHVADVVIDGASVGPVTTYTFSAVTANHAIGATFAVDTRTITASAGSNGGISPSGAVTVLYGSSQTFAITPAAHYHVGDVLVDGASVGAVMTYTFRAVTANHAIRATFAVDTRTITASAGSNGGISPSGAVMVPYGGSQTFTITPAPSYHIEDLIVDGASVGAVTTYTFDDVVANHAIRASFSNEWAITANAEENGSITPSGTIIVGNGRSQTFTIAPAEHHHVADVVVDGASVGPVTTYTFDEVTRSHTIGATFAVDTRIVTANAGAHGNISPSGAVVVPYGGSQAFAMEPASGYHVADVRVDGASVGAPTRYLFSDITASHTIAATFAIGDAPRAVFFGSSTTEGTGASDTAHRWTSLVAACFGWTEVNQGRGGSTMTMLDASGTSAEARWSNDVVARQPDIVVIQYGANDVTELVPLGAPDQPQTFRHATHVVLGGIAGALPSAPVYVVEPQPAIALGAHREPYDAALAEGATAFGLPIVHAGEAFPAGGQYASDQIHLSDAGHSALARYVANRIAEIEGWTMPACTF